MIRVICACGASYNVKDEMDGKRVRCPKCGGAIEVRRQAQPAADADAGEREERFVLACFEDGGGQGFDWRAAGERVGAAPAEADAMARQLAGRGYFQALSAAGEGVFTPAGRALAADLLRDKAKDPRYWTEEQRAFLRAAFERCRGGGNPPFDCGAAAAAAGLTRQSADRIRAGLVRRGILADARQMRTFTPAGLDAVRRHFT